METSISRPKRRSRLSQDRLGKALSSLDGTFLSHPRTRVSSWPCRHPKSVGNMRATILPSSFCWVSKRPPIWATRFSGTSNSFWLWLVCWRIVSWGTWRAPSYRLSSSVRFEGNHAPFGANMANDFMRLEDWVDKLWKTNRFHAHPCERPHESWLNSRNGEVRE